MGHRDIVGAWAGRRLLTGILLAGLTSACAAPPTTPTAPRTTAATPTSQPTAHGQHLVLDGGALILRPTTAPARVSRATARFDLAHSSAGGAGFTPGHVSYGALTITATPVPGDPGGLPGPLPRFRSTPAWVITYNPGSSSCPGQSKPGPTLPPTASQQTLFVLDATTGQAAIYLGAGAGGCTPSPKPHLDRVAELLSVPWTAAHTAPGNPVTSITARYPGCAVYFTMGTSTSPKQPTQVGVAVRVPFGTCPTTAHDVVLPLAGTVVAPLRHAPTGPLLTGGPLLTP